MLIDFRQLFPKHGINPKGVLHVGANVGEEAPVYLELGIKNQVWIEANVELLPELNKNLKALGNDYAMCFCFAAGDENKQTTLHISNNGSQSSSILELGTHKMAHPEVHYISDQVVNMGRLDSFLSYCDDEDQDILVHDKKHIKRNDFTRSLDFLNMDIQGAELKALRGMGDLLHQFKWAYLEVNKEELYKGCALVGEIDEYLAGFGFKRVETKWCGNTGWGDALYIK